MELQEVNELQFDESEGLTRLRCELWYPFSWKGWPLSNASWKLIKHIEHRGCGLEVSSSISTQIHSSWKVGARGEHDVTTTKE